MSSRMSHMGSGGLASPSGNVYVATPPGSYCHPPPIPGPMCAAAHRPTSSMGSSRGLAGVASYRSQLFVPGHEPSAPVMQQQQEQHQPPHVQPRQLFPEAPTFSETIEGLASRMPLAAHMQPEHGLVLWQDIPPPPEERARINRPFGLGAIQQSGRDEVLQQFYRQEPPAQSAEKQGARQPR